MRTFDLSQMSNTYFQENKSSLKKQLETGNWGKQTIDPIFGIFVQSHLDNHCTINQIHRFGNQTFDLYLRVFTLCNRKFYERGVYFRRANLGKD